ncbi:MAG: peptidoglycan recognition protein [Myxococcales bacterium]|nr:peptidoglycan recognition protein [Myxococcales bacterium]MCB9521017.1 peptidoglycan recognition protein [Myxococcales bacterium]MCB9531656.1 peptidoglycan recognition protein [Myxococcales bacterium]
MRTGAALVIAWVSLAACASERPHVAAAPAETRGADSAATASLDLPTAADVQAVLSEDGTLPVGAASPIRQVGVIAIGASPIRVSLSRGGMWSPPVELETTWREGELFVARIVLDEAADDVRVLEASALRGLHLDAFAEPVAHLEWPLARDLPLAAPAREPAAGGHVTARMSALPAWVVTRDGWGARDPGTLCGDPHTPRMITVHHTDTPTADTVTPEQRVRGIQAYHIDSNGWCDIGYHFLVAQDGRVFQGRATELRTGAHTGGANTDNIGVSFIGQYNDAPPAAVMFEGGAAILRWLADTYAIALDAAHVFGHRDFGETDCPGDALYARLMTLASQAAGTEVPPEPTGTLAADLSLRLVGPTAILEDGASIGVADALPEDTLDAVIELTNASDVVLRGVRVAYAWDAEFVRPLSYRIESDYPALDRTTWTLNSADAEETNPARDALGASGTLAMHAFSPGETKRVTVSMTALADSIGRTGPDARGEIDHVDLYAWLHSVDDVFGPQTQFDVLPFLNGFGVPVRGHVDLDVLGEAAWFFDGQGAGGREGWSGCSLDTTAAISEARGALTLAVDASGEAGCATSPAWTRIDSDRWDGLVLTMRSADPSAPVTLAWTDSTGDHSLQTLASSAPEPVVVHPTWTGEVSSLRVETDAEWLDLFDIYAQDSATRSTASTRASYIDDPSEGGDDTGGRDVGVVDNADAGLDVRPVDGDAGGGDSTVTPGASRDVGSGGDTDAGTVTVRGCSTSSGFPGVGTALLSSLALVATRRRRLRPGAS